MDEALKRGGAIQNVSLDAHEAEVFYSEMVHDTGDEEFLDHAWATTIFQAATEAIRLEHTRQGKGHVFEALFARLTGDRETTHQECAEELGMSESAVKTNFHRLRKRLGNLMLEEVKRTILPDDDPKEELRYLLTVLAKRNENPL